jgi:regulatory protein
MERSDGARRSGRVDRTRGDGLAPVTYLPGVLSASTRPAQVQPLDVPSDRSIADTLTADVLAPDTLTADVLAADVLAADTEFAARADARAQKAERISMNALTRRGMSKREVERSLRARELDDETVASELDRLEGVGLIDDTALAQNLVGILQERKGLGRSAIAAELTRRLLTPAAIEYALELIDTSDELGRAREIAVKRASQLRSYDRETAVRRLNAFLMRRGYSGSTVRAAVEHALPATPGSRVRFQ